MPAKAASPKKTAAKPAAKPAAKAAAKPAAKAPKATATGPKTPRFYPAYDVPTPKAKSATKVGAPKLRASISPGTVLILLAGRFRGKRVVFLKQLESGLLLVTGPFKVNGVPVRRVNQSYCIATSTKVKFDAKSVADINDKYFAREAAEKKGDEDKFFATEGKAKEVSDQRKKDQAAVDKGIMSGLDETLKAYLGAKFSLKKGDRPHEMKF